MEAVFIGHFWVHEPVELDGGVYDCDAEWQGGEANDRVGIGGLEGGGIGAC